MRFIATTLLLTGMIVSAVIVPDSVRAAAGEKEESSKAVPAESTQRARFKFVKEYGSERELNAERYKNRGWIEKTGDGLFFYDGRGKLKKEIKRKLSSIENPINERIDDRRFRRTHAEIFNDGLGALVREREYKVDGHDMIVPATWTIYGPQGEMQGRFVDDRYYRPSPDGKHFVGTLSGAGWVDGVLRFRDENGEVTHEHKPFEWEVLEERIVFSEDGSHGVYLCEGADRGGVAVFNSSAGVLGTYTERKWGPVGPGEAGPDRILRPLVRVLPAHKKILVVDSRLRLTCFDFNGNKLWSQDYSDLASSSGYGHIYIGIPGSSNKALLFLVRRENSVLKVLNLENAQTLNHLPLPILKAPAAKNSIYPDYPEKPWDQIIAYVFGNKVVLAYANARTSDKRIVSGALLVDSYGKHLDMLAFENPESFWTDGTDNFFLISGQRIKRWEIRD